MNTWLQEDGSVDSLIRHNASLHQTHNLKDTSWYRPNTHTPTATRTHPHPPTHPHTHTHTHKHTHTDKSRQIPMHCTRETSIQGEGDGTACAVVNQLWAWLFTMCRKYFSKHQQPILQLFDNSTSGILNFLLYRDFPDSATQTGISYSNEKPQLLITLMNIYCPSPSLFSLFLSHSFSFLVVFEPLTKEEEACQG